MAGYDFEFYETGTISVTAGQKPFTGSGTAWKLRGCEGALVIVSGAGSVNFVSSLTTDAAGEFRTEWVGPTLANAQYTMWLPSAVAATALANHQRLAEIIASIQGAQPESLNLTALAGLAGDPGTIVRFLQNGSFDLVEPKDVGIQDPKGSLGKLADLTLGNRQILQTDETGALKTLALAASKFLRTDANGDLALSDLGTAAIALLNLAGTAAADRMPYLTSANAAALATLTAYARTALAATNEAAARTIIGANRPMFSAIASSDISISNGTNANIPLSNVTVNVGNSWNGTRFLCPESGNYFFSFSPQWNQGGDNTGYGIARIKRNGSNIGGSTVVSKTLFFVPMTIQMIIPLAVGDTVNFEFELSGATGTVVLQGNNTKGMGFLIR